MFEFIAGWLILSVAIWGAASLLPGVKIDNFGTAIGVAAVFSLLNFLFGWILFIVIGITTLGLGFILFFITQWVINALMLKATDAIVDTFHVQSFGWALGAALLISLFSAVGHAIVF